MRSWLGRHPLTAFALLVFLAAWTIASAIVGAYAKGYADGARADLAPTVKRQAEILQAVEPLVNSIFPGTIIMTKVDPMASPPPLSSILVQCH